MKKFFRGIGMIAVVLALVIALMGSANALTRTVGNYIVSNNAGFADLAEFNFTCSAVANYGGAAYNAALTTIYGATLTRPKMTVEVYGPSSGFPSGDPNFLACLTPTAGAGDNTINLFLNAGLGANLNTYKTYCGAIAAMTTECLFFNKTNWSNADLLALSTDSVANPTNYANSGYGRLSYVVNGLAQYVKNCVYLGGPRLTAATLEATYDLEALVVLGTTAFNVDNTAVGASVVSGATGWLGAGDGFAVDVNTIGYGGVIVAPLGFGDIGLGFDLTGLATAPLEVIRMTALGFFIAKSGVGKAITASNFVTTLATQHTAVEAALGNDNNALSVVRTFEAVYNGGLPGTRAAWDSALRNIATAQSNPFSIQYDQFWYGRDQFM